MALGLVLLTMCGPSPLAGRVIGSGMVARILPGSKELTIAIWLTNRDLPGEEKLLGELSRPASPAYHHWLSTTEFEQRFAPTTDAIATVTHFLESQRLRVLPESHANLLLVRGSIDQIEQTFHVLIFSLDGIYFPASTPQIPAALTSLVTGVFGLTNRPLAQANTPLARSRSQSIFPPYGGGVEGSGLTPAQIAGIYNATPLHSQGNLGQGTTLGLVEFSGYKASDIQTYEHAYHLPHMTLVDVPVQGGMASHANADEVELDIELQVAMAPGARRILVYNAPKDEIGRIAEYQRIAQDNLVDAISTSWGSCAYYTEDAFMQAENQIFLQMALQGQSLFASSGDAGAYDCARRSVLPPIGQELQVDDPGSQPYITSVGGTSFQGDSDRPLFDPGQNPHPVYPGQWNEKPWSYNCYVIVCNTGNSNVSSGASGGGISRQWGEPDYALDAATGRYYPGIMGWYSRSGAYCQQQAGVLCREIPDISLNADPRTGYSFYCTDGMSCPTGWDRVGGTSASAPLWAGIAALAIHQNQNQRLGLLNFPLYQINAQTFHDIISHLRTGLPYQSGPSKDGSYRTVSGYAATRNYDLATGIGTPDIAQLVQNIVALSPGSVQGNG
jgi:kumamolisin